MSKQHSNPRFILASSSVYRANLLARLPIEFSCQSPQIDEGQQNNEPAEDYVKRLSIDKAKVIGKDNPESWVIGSDQAAVFAEKIIGKSLTKEKAVEQLTQFSGNKVTFLTGVCLYQAASQECFYQTDKVEVVFRKLSTLEIEHYLALDEPFDCAGSFKIESNGVLLFEQVYSQDPTSLEGLSLITLNKLLTRAGIHLLGE